MGSAVLDRWRIRLICRIQCQRPEPSNWELFHFLRPSAALLDDSRSHDDCSVVHWGDGQYDDCQYRSASLCGNGGAGELNIDEGRHLSFLSPSRPSLLKFTRSTWWSPSAWPVITRSSCPSRLRPMRLWPVSWGFRPGRWSKLDWDQRSFAYSSCGLSFPPGELSSIRNSPRSQLGPVGMRRTTSEWNEVIRSIDMRVINRNKLLLCHGDFIHIRQAAGPFGSSPMNTQILNVTHSHPHSSHANTELWIVIRSGRGEEMGQTNRPSVSMHDNNTCPINNSCQSDRHGMMSR